MQADREFRKNPNDWLVETIKSREMNGHFAVEDLAIVGLTILTAHDTTTFASKRD
jgi:hypothetical protein